MDLGNAIKTLRKQKKITQKQLAELSDISTNALCSIETGQSFPSMATIGKICSSLNVPESYLLLFSITEDDSTFRIFVLQNTNKKLHLFIT